MELCKLLLHLSDTFALEDFLSRRHKAMVALLVLCPALVTPNLTGELYGINYSLRHRLDILEVCGTIGMQWRIQGGSFEFGRTPLFSK